MVDDLFDIEEDAAAPSGSETEGAPADGQVENRGRAATIAVRVRTEPGSGRAVVAGRQGRALRVRVAAPPGSDRAARGVAEALAELFGVVAVHVSPVVSARDDGQPRERIMRMRVEGVDVEEARRQLERALAASPAGAGPRGRMGTSPGRR